MQMKKFRIIYWCNGNKKVQKVEAFSRYNAKTKFYLEHPFDDIISIEEVSE